MQTIPAAQAAGPASDAGLAARAAAGTQDALIALMRRHNQLLYRTARSILKDDADAEDAVQEAYLHAFRSIDAFRGEASLSTWLVRIVVNESLARLRARRRRTEVIWLAGDAGGGGEDAEADAMSEHPSMQPERAALNADLRRLLERRIDELPDAFRTVFVLRAVQDMSVEETARCLDLAPATVRTRYFRARALLREALARNVDLGIDSAFSFAGERCDRIVAGVLARLQLDREPAPPGA